MKSIPFLWAIILLLSISSCSLTKKIKYDYNNDIYKVKKEYAPDTRIAVFNIYPKKNKKSKSVILKGETNVPDAINILIQRIEGRGITVVDSIRILPDSRLGDRIFGVVRLSVCNIRTQPKHSSELATQAILGTPVKILKEKDGWFFIQTPDRYLGWVDAAGIEQMDRFEKQNWIESTKIIYTSVYGFSYDNPDMKAFHISDLIEGDILQLKGESLDKKYWIVSYPDGRMAYVNKEESQILTDYLDKYRHIEAENVLSKAHMFIGIPYLWGGTSAKMMDCSGFTKTVYFMFGVILPRDASQQVNIGKKVKITSDFKNLEKGDLLFFGSNRKDGSERITHVAIYMGNGKIIHETGEVKIQSLNRHDPDFVEDRLNSLKQARRIIGYEGEYGIKKIKDIKEYGL